MTRQRCAPVPSGSTNECIYETVLYQLQNTQKYNVIGVPVCYWRHHQQFCGRIVERSSSTRRRQLTHDWCRQRLAMVNVTLMGCRTRCQNSADSTPACRPFVSSHTRRRRRRCRLLSRRQHRPAVTSVINDNSLQVL